MSTFSLEPTPTAQWQALVCQAAQDSKTSLSEEMESYLVFLLMRHIKDNQVGGSAIAMEYLRALHENSVIKQENLRDVADHCLLLSGLFPQIAEKRNVSISYFVNVGRTAYLDLSETITHIGSVLFKEISEQFIHLMDILLTIRSYSTTPVLLPIQAFDLWNDTGSDVAYKLIR